MAARSPDGVAEAVEDPARPFCLGVQWHPEEMPEHSATRGLFSAFREACRVRVAPRRPRRARALRRA